MPKGIFKRIIGVNCGLPSQGFQKGHKKNIGRRWKWSNESIQSIIGRKHTEKTKKKMSNSRIGKTSNNKGKHWNLSEETKRKMIVAKNHISQETRQKLREAHKGDKSHLWKGGITPKNKLVRAGMEYRLWRESVFTRDDYTCQKCGVRGVILNPHHIKNFSDYRELRFAIDNGITFCETCHIEFHNKYSRKNNTKEQIEEYMFSGK